MAANLVRPLLLEVARNLHRPPEQLVVSGLLRAEADEIAAAFAARGMAETDRREGTEWSALLLEAGDRIEDVQAPPADQGSRAARPC